MSGFQSQVDQDDWPLPVSSSQSDQPADREPLPSTAVNIPRTVVPVLHRSTRQRWPVDQFAPWSFTLRREECDDL